MSIPQIPTNVKKVFDSYPSQTRDALLELRTLILETAQETVAVGSLEETLKWGQISYLTSETKTGTTLRIGADDEHPRKLAIYVHCQTTLINTFKKKHPKNIEYLGTRCLRYDPNNPEAIKTVKKFIQRALTYHAENAITANRNKKKICFKWFLLV